ncbi:uncharacterized protein LOC111249959 [Varroa destructor]|uniref:COMM domain-containing protein n=1 Tax=Varroa destructor TaxID=109461 RepID=A0A7M7K1C1_VARDE|nr:uncharacterized protein LOC111249959 [Varroa destructor]XP_022660186.1 uncharacterized protein LOC111249959 [Varroa destructor]XP_022660187.1 uncharacterized protein LOC111249959 [Varroa destructor]XP_022660188.1 uncharacterized protein LOC111249959 [Varroa destructor]XP_022660189.1 uncharacterized protein LOC111249959 [Varroa destructor]XP_022660190.1 uncharacterized protein LOC111249959 [Varroa destructor]XP_022660191.1 uncharacterized protein LOC111249959 [Varroa destructor]XP_02266019
MFSSTELKTLQLALPTLNSLSVADLECLCNAAIARIKAETTPSNERHLGDSLQLSSYQLTTCLSGLHCVLQSCVLHLTKPLALLKSLQELGLTAELAEKIASVWALNAQSLVSWARGDQTIQGKRLFLVSWEISSNVPNPQPGVALAFRVGDEQKVLQLDRAQLQMLFDRLQDVQKELDDLIV